MVSEHKSAYRLSRDVPRLGQFDHVNQRRVAARPARPAFFSAASSFKRGVSRGRLAKRLAKRLVKRIVNGSPIARCERLETDMLAETAPVSSFERTPCGSRPKTDALWSSRSTAGDASITPARLIEETHSPRLHFFKSRLLQRSFNVCGTTRSTTRGVGGIGNGRARDLPPIVMRARCVGRPLVDDLEVQQCIGSTVTLAG